MIVLADPRYEPGPHTKTSKLGKAESSWDLGRQSQMSDDEGIAPAAYCSGCGSDSCCMGADRRRLQRKAARLAALVDELIGMRKAQIEEVYGGDAGYILSTKARRGPYYKKEMAEDCVEEFRHLAARQLAHMAAQRSHRAAEHKVAMLARGVLEEPGTGYPLWTYEDVEEHVTDQVDGTHTWAGARIATENVDDRAIENAYARRPQARPETESLKRQRECSKAAAILAKALEAARLPLGERRIAGQLIPGLLTEYLKYCGIAEFAPIEVGGPNQPYTRIMGLFRVIYDAFKECEPPTDGDLCEVLKTGEGMVAKASAVRSIVDARFDSRVFRALQTHDPDRDESQVALVSTCASVGEWPGCLSRLKISGLESISPGSAMPLAVEEIPAASAAERDRAKKRLIEETGEICQLGSGMDEHLRYFANRCLGQEKASREGGDLVRRRVPVDPGAEVSQEITQRTVFDNLRQQD